MRQRVANGSLFIDTVQRAADQGTYTCTARNKHNFTSQRSVEVRVLGKRTESKYFFGTYLFYRLHSVYRNISFVAIIANFIGHVRFAQAIRGPSYFVPCNLRVFYEIEINRTEKTFDIGTFMLSTFLKLSALSINYCKTRVVKYLAEDTQKVFLTLFKRRM